MLYPALLATFSNATGFALDSALMLPRRPIAPCRVIPAFLRYLAIVIIFFFSSAFFIGTGAGLPEMGLNAPSTVSKGIAKGAKFLLSFSIFSSFKVIKADILVSHLEESTAWLIPRIINSKLSL